MSREHIPQELHRLCALQNIGPSRVQPAFNPDSTDFLCSRLFYITGTDIEEGATGRCDVAVSYAAADGFPEGYVSRITEKGDNLTCPLYKDVKVGDGLEYNTAGHAKSGDSQSFSLQRASEVSSPALWRVVEGEEIPRELIEFDRRIFPSGEKPQRDDIG